MDNDVAQIGASTFCSSSFVQQKTQVWTSCGRKCLWHLEKKPLGKLWGK
jgi:hypothetical protein